MGKLHMAWLSLKADKKSAGVAVAVLAVGLVLLAALIGAAIGRYQTQMKSEAPVRAKEFYFTSDLLDGGIHTLAPGSTAITFTLGNHADELRISEVDIIYKVTVTAEGGAAAPSVEVEYNNTEKKLPLNTKQDDSVTIKNLTPGTYTITATGTGGYEKTLTATIKVLSDEAQIYQHKDFAPEYTLLTVWNEGGTEEKVTITYAGIPDNTNPNMTDWQTGTEEVHGEKTNISIPAHSSMVFRFFDSGTIRVVKADGAEVEAKVPN